MSSESWRKYVVPTPERLTPKRHRGSIVNYGPMELGLREEVVYEGGPDEFIANNPQLFATGTTSSHEGYAYWALLKIIGEPGVPGKNGLVWYYQSKVGGGSNRAGGAVVDFMVEGALPSRDIGIRIVTPFFHDLVVDVNSRNYITDHTGVAAIQAMTKAIEGRPDYNPLFRRWGV
jgi:hypothetical protein